MDVKGVHKTDFVIPEFPCSTSLDSCNDAGTLFPAEIDFYVTFSQ